MLQGLANSDVFSLESLIGFELLTRNTNKVDALYAMRTVSLI